MAQGPQNLPNDIDELKALVRARDNHIALLEEKLRLASLKRFGARSEKGLLAGSSGWGSRSHE
jgi:hypothetical protein